MIRNLKIGPRLLLLILVQTALLLVLGAAAVYVVDLSVETTSSLNQKVAQEAKVVSLSEGVRTDLIGTVHALNGGGITWGEAAETLKLARENFESGWTDIVEGLNDEDREFVGDVLTPHLDGVRAAFEHIAPIIETRNRARLSLFITNDLDWYVGPFLDALVASTSLQQLEAAEAAAIAQTRGEQLFQVSAGAAVFGTLLAALLGTLIYRSIVTPLGTIESTVRNVAEGNLSARTGIEGRDELGVLGSAFDNMLDERVATLANAQAENDQLNDSVIGLLEAVSKLSRRDLTVRVPVTEDVTGPVADSLNLLTGETAKVLSGVRDVSELVSVASTQVKEQSDRVIDRANQEREEVVETAATLALASEHMIKIARLAQASVTAADEAIGSTQTAMETVTSTVTGINDIRDTIRETEKRIKRLGERSQEISGVVDLINTIAERTHILALNASMHAASAGEAGRGFAVVADEVQRLAENARDATSQISTLVSNIQLETSETVNTMNDVITRVVAGSKLAEQAGEQMEDTRDRTAALVAMVQRIARGSLRQARTSKALRRRARVIEKSTLDTSAELDEQSAHTQALVEHARRLVAAVNVFVLPGAAESAPVDAAPDATVVPEEPSVRVVANG